MEKRKRLVLEFDTYEVSSLQEISKDVYVLRVPRKFSFRAGQVVAVKLKEDDPHRLYSIASGENEGELGILFDINPEGLLTPNLAKLSPGNRIFISNAFGFFIDDDRPAWWIATGTGIAPFIAMFRTIDISNKTLIQGGRGATSFYFQEEFENGNLGAYIRCSSVGADGPYYQGRLSQWLREQKSFDPDLRYFLCGNAEMVVEVRDYLISKGVLFENIRAEIYF